MGASGSREVRATGGYSQPVRVGPGGVLADSHRSSARPARRAVGATATRGAASIRSASHLREVDPSRMRRVPTVCDGSPCSIAYIRRRLPREGVILRSARAVSLDLHARAVDRVGRRGSG
jgi:hypothetical protein